MKEFNNINVEDLQQEVAGLAKQLKKRDEKLRRKQEEGNAKLQKQLSAEQNRPKAVSGGKKKKPVNQEEEERIIKETALNLIQKMNRAHQQDKESYKKKQPAIQKLILLDDITRELRKRSIQQTFKDNGGIRALGKWITPYSDETCPNVRILQEILQCIDSLQIEIDFEDASELRQIVRYYSTGSAKVPQVVN